MPQSPDAGDGHPVARLAVQRLEPLVDGDARAKDRRDLGEPDVLGQVTHVAGISQHIFRIAAVDRIARHLLVITQCLPAGDAVLATAACRMQPGDTDTVAFADALYLGTHGEDMSHSFMPRNEGQTRLDRPVSVRRMQIGMAHAAGGHLHQHPVPRHLGDGHVFDRRASRTHGQPLPSSWPSQPPSKEDGTSGAVARLYAPLCGQTNSTLSRRSRRS